MVVKSSLTLSLGLVGALSIVRFRTPIKEPEELVYLFLAIALGLGYGAHQTMITTLTFLVILVVIWIWLSRKASNKRDEYNFLVEWSDPKLGVENLLSTIVQEDSSADLLKYSSGPLNQSIFLKIIISNIQEIENIRNRIIELDQNASNGKMHVTEEGGFFLAYEKKEGAKVFIRLRHY